jgi:hypothetical protein
VRRLRKHGTDRAECLTNTYSLADAHAYSFANAWTVVGLIHVAIVHGDGANTKPHCR